MRRCPLKKLLTKDDARRNSKITIAGSGGLKTPPYQCQETHKKYDIRRLICLQLNLLECNQIRREDSILYLGDDCRGFFSKLSF